MKSHRHASLLLLVLSVFLPRANVAAQQLEWIRQLGTPQYDSALGVSVDPLGNIYISGITYGVLDESIAENRRGDVFLSKLGPSGDLLWTRQLATAAYDFSFDVSADTLGNVYVAGGTEGSLGAPNLSGLPAPFVSKYDASGTLKWVRQLEMGGLTTDVSTDSTGYVYISGFGSGGSFVSKYDTNGLLQWMRQPAPGDTAYCQGLSVDSWGNVYVSGFTDGNLSGWSAGRDDAFLCKYNSAGALQWIRQLGSELDDEFNSIYVDLLGNIYASGETQGSLDGRGIVGSCVLEEMKKGGVSC